MGRRAVFAFAALFVLTGTAGAQEKPAIFPQLGHSSSIFGAAFSPDGKILASASQDKSVKLWDMTSGRELRTLVEKSEVVDTVAFSPDRKTLASGDWDKTIILWDVASGRALRSLGGTVGVVWSVAFSPDGKLLAAGTKNQIPSDAVAVDADQASNVEVWDLANGKKRVFYTGNPNFVRSVAFSPDGKTLSSAGGDGIKLWDVATGRELRALVGSTKSIASAAFSPDGKIVAGGGADGITLWNVESGKVVRTFGIPYDEIASIAFLRDGKYIAAGSSDQSVRFWDVANGRQGGTLVPGNGMNGTFVAVSPDGKFFAAGTGVKSPFDTLPIGPDGVDDIRVWDVASGRGLYTLGSRVARVESVAFSKQGNVLASAGDDATIKLWDITTGRQVHSLAGHTDEVESAAFSSDGRVLASGSADRTVKLWDVASGRILRTLQQEGDGIHAVLFSPDGKSLATGSDNGTITIRISKSGRVLRTFHHLSGLSAVSFSPDGKLLAAVGGFYKQNVSLWNVASGKMLRTWDGTDGDAQAVTFSPDGKLLAWSAARTIYLSDVASGRNLQTLNRPADLPEHSDDISSLAFSPDGKILAAGSDDHTIRLWDVASARTLRTLSEHLGIVTSVQFSPDGKSLASGSWDGTVRIWDAASGKERASLVAFDDGSSIAVTPEGYFDDSSEQAEENLNVRIKGRVFGIASLRENFFRPDVVRKALAGGSLKEFGSLEDIKLSPVVEFADLPAATTATSLKVTLHITNGGGGFGAVRMFWNGTVIQQDSDLPQAGDTLSRDYTVPLISGDNTLRATASNADGTMWSDANNLVAAKFPVTKSAAAHGTLHALVVGIQDFPNAPHNNLNYSNADAKLVADTLNGKAAPLFDRLDVQLLTGAPDTDKVHLERALKAMQASAQPGDEFVFYVASHGIVAGGEYYLMTSDASSLDPKVLKVSAISAKELSELLANIHVAKKLVILDTCEAGAAGTALQSAEGGINQRTATTILARDYGFTVLAATESNQEALEGKYQNHGLFTYVVADGLAGRAADRTSGIVSSFLLADYVNERVPQLAMTALHRKQQPTLEKSGQTFPITKVK